jgi:hypothetical protein
MKTESRPVGVDLRTPSLARENGNAKSLVRQLLLVAASLFLVFTWLLSNDPAVERRLYAFLHPPRVPLKADITAQLAADPRLGSRPLKSRALALVNTSLPGKRLPRLLIYVGECSSCLSGDLKQWVRDAHEAALAPVLISTAPKTYAQAFVKERGLQGVPVISDPHLEILAGLNPVFAPRAYVLDKQGTLRWLQRDAQLASARLKTDNTFGKSLEGNAL